MPYRPRLLPVYNFPIFGICPEIRKSRPLSSEDMGGIYEIFLLLFS